jgi:hypothetical protein
LRGVLEPPRCGGVAAPPVSRGVSNAGTPAGRGDECFQAFSPRLATAIGSIATNGHDHDTLTRPETPREARQRARARSTAPAVPRAPTLARVPGSFPAAKVQAARPSQTIPARQSTAPRRSNVTRRRYDMPSDTGSGATLIPSAAERWAKTSASPPKPREALHRDPRVRAPKHAAVDLEQPATPELSHGGTRRGHRPPFSR